MSFSRLIIIALLLGSSTQLRAEGGAALFGAAAITAAISPAVVAGIQASADKRIAAINADLSEYQVNRYSLASEYQGLLASQTAIALAGIQYAVNGMYQTGVSERLAMQLDAQRRASELRQAMDRERLHNQYSLLDRQLDLQEKAMDQQFALSKKQSSGELFDQRNSGAGLSVRSYGLAKAGYKTSQQASARLLSSIKYGVKRYLPRPKAVLKPIVSTVASLADRPVAVTTRAMAPHDGWPRHRGATLTAPAEGAHQGHHHGGQAEETSVVRLRR